MRSREEWIEDGARPRHERGGAPGMQGPGNIPGMGRDQPNPTGRDPETLRGHPVRLRSRFEAPDRICREELFEVFAETGIAGLGFGHVTRRIGQGG